MSAPVFRFYTHTLSSIHGILPHAYAHAHASTNNEIHIVLAFARDYDSQGNYTTGEFIPYFDNITPQDIQRIKKDAPPSIKFFLSIGGRDSRFPFAVNNNDQSKTWIRNATKSLGRIIPEYYIDGIDVYYEYINPDALSFFSTSIATVIENLKVGSDPIISQASITVSDPLINIYVELCKKYANLIDKLVYQCFTVTVHNPTPEDLVNVFLNKLFPYYPREKILAGYSDFHNDQTNVTPDIFVRAFAQLINEGPLGFSLWYGNPAP